MKILITYASSYGSTQSIAERIETRLAVASIGEVTLLPISKSTAPEDFDVIIIGSCIHMQRWLKPARQFLTSHSLFLHENPKPIWAFSVGMPTPGEAERKEEEAMEKKVRKQVDVRGHKLFQGKRDSRDMWGVFRCCFSCIGGKFEDRRDFEAVDAWADEIVGQLRIDIAGVGQGGNW